ncbi:MAG: hypothetical protein RMM29_04085 [Planctomycetota bacterium]|nr:hypothetical protein [Planctomycetota bacterium]MCX8039854.1 hypothetical protein [Planctomycetota bacterium]MDW8372815.1 hypothetical protein [Planctomycetota bacterium]
MRGLLLWLCLCCALAAGEAQPPRPGRERPAAPAEPALARFAWDEYETLVVVGEGVGLVRPAWVVTWQRGELQVGYRATAFRDAAGRLHIDGRQARCVGPLADRWSPDSFAFADGAVWTLDDIGNGHRAATPPPQPATVDRERWRQALLLAQAIVEGGL